MRQIDVHSFCPFKVFEKILDSKLAQYSLKKMHSQDIIKYMYIQIIGLSNHNNTIVLSNQS